MQMFCLFFAGRFRLPFRFGTAIGEPGGRTCLRQGGYSMKKDRLFAVALATAAALSSGCFIRPRNDDITHTFSVPKLTSPECSKIVLDILGQAAGVSKVEPDLQKGALRVTFSTRVTALKNIEYALSEAGFDVDDSIGDPAAKAKLPEGCR
jgi:copper chaperone CopZ